jgi:hypothetical protein
MSNADREDMEISAIAAMTTAEVRAALRQFGLQPLKRLPPELERLRARMKYRAGVNSKVVEELEETQEVATPTPDIDAARKNSSGGTVWVWMCWQFQWLKSAWGVAAFRIALAVTAVALYATVGLALKVRSAAYRSDQPTAINVVTDSAYRKIVLVDFTVSEELRIREALEPLFNSQCTRAFANAGLRSPAEMAMNEGVVIMPSNALYYLSAKTLGLVDERTQMAYQEEFTSGRAQAGTVTSKLYGVQLTTDGRPRIFLHDSAFAGESLKYRRFSLHDVLAHEFIHVGGQPPKAKSVFQHDLAGFEHYDEIMGACR